MSVGKFCNREVVFVHKSAGIAEVARLMRENHVGDLLVVEERAGQRFPVGMVTDRDLVIEVLAEGVDTQGVTVGDVMSFELVTARENDDLFDTIKIMRAKAVRRIPVVDAHGVLVGILSVDDLIDIFSEHLTDLAALIRREQTQEQRRRP
jgi:CBS domain-containing protein